MRLFCILLGTIIGTVATVGRAAIDPSVMKAEADRVAVLTKASTAAVAIFAPGGGGGGSGVVITHDGYASPTSTSPTAAGDAMKCGMADGRVVRRRDRRHRSGGRRGPHQAPGARRFPPR